MAINDLLQTKSPMSIAFYLLLAGTSLIAISYYYRLKRQNVNANIPYIGERPGFWPDIRAKSKWITSSEELLKEGWEQYGGSSFRVLTTIGDLIILRPDLVTEVSNSTLFSSYNAKLKSFAAGYPGAQPMAFGQGQMQVLIDTLIHNITKSLGAATPIMAEEMAVMLDDTLPTTSKGFTEVQFKDIATLIAARLSTRVFLGERVCRNKEWLRLSLDYVSACMTAVAKLSILHPRLRRIFSLLMVEFWKMPRLLRSLQKCLEPEVEARRRSCRSMRPPCEDPLLSQQRPQQLSPLDVLQWMVDKAASGVPFDPVLGQVYLSSVSTHTTSLTMVAAMYELLANPQYLEPLRKEVADVLVEERGWTRRALQKMVLMDSVLKESQRMHMLGAVSGLRYATTNVTLSDGTEVPRGAVVAFPTWPMRDSMFYDDPNKFDAYRFLRVRDESRNGAAFHYVSTSVAHVGFGHGKNACPGRFLASSMLKIALAFLITKYDWRADTDGLTRSISSCAWAPDPKRTIAFRPRSLDNTKLFPIT